MSFDELMVLERASKIEYIPVKNEKEVNKLILELLSENLLKKYKELLIERDQFINSASSEQEANILKKQFALLIGDISKEQSEIKKILYG